MTTAVHDPGDLCRLTTTFTNIAGTPTDPTGITFSIRKPDGAVTTYVYLTDAQLVRSTTGVYYVDFTITLPGRHVYRWSATGALVTAETDEFYARRNEAAA